MGFINHHSHPEGHHPVIIEYPLARQTFYGFQVQVTNAASYLRTQLNAWSGVLVPCMILFLLHLQDGAPFDSVQLPYKCLNSMVYGRYSYTS
jgi:hypothetical protein